MPRPPARMTARLDIVDVRIIARHMFRPAEPFHGLCQALSNTDLRLESRERADEGIVAMQPLDLAVCGTQTLLVTFDIDFRPDRPGDQPGGITHRDFRVR